MKSSTTRPANAAPAPASQSITVKPRVNRQAAGASLKPQKRDNTFSQSRDNREDRGTRRMKTAHSSQTFPHGH